MDYKLTHQQKEIIAVMGRVASDAIVPVDFDNCVTADIKAGHLRKNMKIMAESGFMELWLGTDMIAACSVGEVFAEICPSTFFSAVSSAFPCTFINSFGTSAQQSKYLNLLLDADHIGALAVTEPDAGSDFSGLSTVAEPREDKWVINGMKAFVTNAWTADVFLVLARTQGNTGVDSEFTFFIMDRNTEGLRIDEPVGTLGLKGALVSTVRFSDCIVGHGAILGHETGNGYGQYSKVLPYIQLAVSAYALGVGTACMAEATSYAKDRKVSGKPIGLIENVGSKLALMYTHNDLGRMMTHRAAWSVMQNEQDAGILSSCAKLFTSESVNKIADMAMQIYAGHGYAGGSKIESLYRDARFPEIAYGTSEILRAAIAKDSLDRFKP